MKRLTLAEILFLSVGIVAVGATDTDVIKKGATIECVKESVTLIAPSVIEAAPILVVDPIVFDEPVVVGDEEVIGNYETFNPLPDKPPKNSASTLTKVNLKLRQATRHKNRILSLRPDI